jgi:hypothetical protein
MLESMRTDRHGGPSLIGYNQMLTAWMLGPSNALKHLPLSKLIPG